MAASSDVVEAIYVWVVATRDDGSSAAHVSMRKGADIPPGATSWSTDPATAIHHGTFRPGPATGLALAVATTPAPGNKTVTAWWVDTIEIVAEQGGVEDGGASSA